MANFDEDIKRITDEVLSDGTVDQIIREKVAEGIEKAVSSSFNYGKYVYPSGKKIGKMVTK